MKNLLFVVLQISINLTVFAQPVPGPNLPYSVSRNIRTKEYKVLQENFCKGWNTWYNNSVMTHVVLPEAFAINLCLVNYQDYLKDVLRSNKNNNRPEEVTLGLRSEDASYTSLMLKYKNEQMTVESATDGQDIVILVTPISVMKNKLVVEAGLLFNREGTIGMENNVLLGKFKNRSIEVRLTKDPITHAYASSISPRLTLELNEEVGIYTGRHRTLDEIKQVVRQKRLETETRVTSFGELAEAYKAMQTIMAWNTIYDAQNERAITPVARIWSASRAGFVLFGWDSYFTSLMFSIFNKELAYINAVEITKAITSGGFIPNVQAPHHTSFDRSQPPIGSMVAFEIYERYKEKWFLQEVYDELLTWNRWWDKERNVEGYLAWGSNKIPDSLAYCKTNTIQMARLESGLDNSPMYDDIPFNTSKNVMELADVGLMSLYVMDCFYLAKIAEVLGNRSEKNELEERASTYKQKLNTLWDEQMGIYLNKRLDTGEKSYRLSPTNFYPMLAKACSQKQAETMIKKHYFNSNEFHGEYVMPSISRNDSAFRDNNYWRGRIWAPMNFLVYMGMKNYNLPNAKKDIVERSEKLLMKSWKESGSIYENYNANTGRGDDVISAEDSYLWGSLLVLMRFWKNDN